MLITFYIETIATCEARHNRNILVIVNSVSQPTFTRGQRLFRSSAIKWCQSSFPLSSFTVFTVRMNG